MNRTRDVPTAVPHLPRRRSTTLPAVLAATVFFTMSWAPADAWVITQINLDPNFAVVTTTLLNKNSSSDYYEIHKYFRQEIPSVLGPVELSFTREANDPATIVISDEIIYNMVPQGPAWDGFQMVLSFDPNQGTVGFVNPSSASAWQQSGGAARLGGVPSSAGSTEIDWEGSGGQVVPAGRFGDANCQLVITGVEIDAGDLPMGDSFVLEERPATEVPELNTLAVFSLGMAAAAMQRRRSRRTSIEARNVLEEL